MTTSCDWLLSFSSPQPIRRLRCPITAQMQSGLVVSLKLFSRSNLSESMRTYDQHRRPLWIEHVFILDTRLGGL